jgi:hypothetical protein
MKGSVAIVSATMAITITTVSDSHPEATDSRSALVGSSGR